MVKNSEFEKSSDINGHYKNGRLLRNTLEDEVELIIFKFKNKI